MFSIFKKVATNETSTLHYITCTRIALENFNNNDQGSCFIDSGF